jgi:putative heme iron utilization protein
VAYAEGKKAEAVKMMRSAADREDASEKHVAMENRLWPMRELLRDLLLAMHESAPALKEYETSLQAARNRYRSFYGAAKAAEGEPLGASRVTLVGNVLPVPHTELAEARKIYLERHANSKYWVAFEDFSFYRMNVVDVCYVGGFGVMGWVSDSEYDRSRPDPLADSMAEIIQHMNADHKDALDLLARKFARIESTDATMTAVGRLGFHVRLKTPDGMRGARIAFLTEVSNPAETRKVLVEMVQQARSQAE